MNSYYNHTSLVLNGGDGGGGGGQFLKFSMVPASVGF